MATEQRRTSCLVGLVLLVTAFTSSLAQAPQLVQSLRSSYTIDPSLTPEFNECRFRGNPQPTVQWSREGQSLPTSEQEASNGVYYFPNNGSLVLQRATSSNSGNYVCTGTNLFGSVTDETMLTISQSSGAPWYGMWYMWFIYALILWALLIPLFVVLFFYRKRTAEKDLPPPDPWIGN